MICVKLYTISYIRPFRTNSYQILKIFLLQKILFLSPMFMVATRDAFKVQFYFKIMVVFFSFFQFTILYWKKSPHHEFFFSLLHLYMFVLELLLTQTLFMQYYIQVICIIIGYLGIFFFVGQTRGLVGQITADLTGFFFFFSLAATYRYYFHLHCVYSESMFVVWALISCLI